MFFDSIGIYGWDPIEPLILSAILADLSILLVGDIGTNKTEGAKAIAQAVLTPRIEFRHYEVPTLNFDDLVGFLNPKNLARGALEFIHTPLSIWKAEAVLFDEINRANPFIQAKLHEVVRTRTVMGLATNLKVVFAAVNPPETYQAGYMDLAIASRFVVVPVPNIKTMKENVIDRILGRNGQPPKPSNLKAVLKQAAGYHFTRKDLQKAEGVAKRVARDLAETEIVFNPRQLKMMVKLLLSGAALKAVTGNPSFSTPDTNTAYVKAVIPEANGIVRSKVNPNMVEGVIRTVVGGFTLGDPIITAGKLATLAQAEITDPLAWMTAMKKLADNEDDPATLRRVITKVRDLTSKEVIDRELATKLLTQLATTLTTQTLLAEDVTATRLFDRLDRITASL